MKVTDGALETMSQILLRCSIIGFVLLLYWWGWLELGGDLAHNMHSRLVPSISKEQFDMIHYVGMLLTKAVIMLLFFVPYLATILVIKKRKTGTLDKTVEEAS